MYSIPLPVPQVVRKLSRSSFGFAVAASLASVAAAQTTISGPLSDSTTGPLTSGTVYVVSSGISVPVGQTLTVQPGVVIKFNFATSFVVGGRLLANGDGVGSIIMTDIRDDSVGGDTNGDGSSSVPGPSFWGSLQLEATADDSIVSGVTTRYGGRFGAAFLLTDSTATLEDCTAEDSGTTGFDLASFSRPTLTGCASVRSNGVAFANVPIQALSSFSQLSASGGGSGDFINVTEGALVPGESVTISAGNLVGNVAVMAQSVSVPVGARLEVGSGSILKWGFATRLEVAGELDMSGTSSAPVVMTGLQDDSVGGDTNGDGSSSIPSRGWWGGVTLDATATGCEFSHGEVHFAGRFGAALLVATNGATLRDCVVTESATSGVNLANLGRPVIEGLVVNGVNQIAVADVPIGALTGFSGLNLSGGPASYVEVSPSIVETGTAVSIEAMNGNANTLVFPSSLIIEPGAELEIGPDVICKMRFATRVQVDGVMTTNGEPDAPVHFTDFRDDTLGGDTNGNADADEPAIAFWGGLVFSDASDGSQITRTEIRYAGRFGAAVRASDASITLDRCRVADTAGIGIDLAESQEPCILNRPVVDRSTGVAAISGVRLDRIGDIFLPSGTGNNRNTIRVSDGLLASDTSIEVQNLWDGVVLIADSIEVPAGLSLDIERKSVFKMGFATRVDVDGAFSTEGSFDRSIVFTDERDDSIGGDTNGDAGATVPSPAYWGGVNLRSTTEDSIVRGLEVRFAGRFGVGVDVTGGRALIQELRIDQSAGDGLRIDEHSTRLERIAVFDCSSDGIHLTGGDFDLRQVTVVDCDRFGITADAAYFGNVSDSILRGNGLGDVSGLTASRVTFSDGDGPLGTGSITLDPAFVDAANGDLRLTLGSPCVDAGDPASPLDPDGTRADMGAYFLNICEPTVACVQSQSFGPCAPVIGFEGFASASRPEPFLVTLDSAPTESYGIFFYSLGQPTFVAGLFGDLCVTGTFRRTPPIATGGDRGEGPCDGRMEFDMNSWIQSGADMNLVPGVTAIGHIWFRYNEAPGGSRFSDGVRVPICP